MSQTKCSRLQKILRLTVLVLLVQGGLAAEAPAQTGLLNRIRALFTRQQQVGVTRDRVGAGTRDPDVCRRVDPPLTALMPDTDEPVMTSAAHPAFWLYVPYALIPNDPETMMLKFVLQDEQGNPVYQSKFTMPETTPSGILSLRIPTSQAALQVGERYHWYFMIYCNDPQETSQPAFVEGVIERQALDVELQEAIAQSPIQSRFLVYAEAGLWYDMLSALDARRANPEDEAIAADWATVLQGVGLEAIAQQPIVGRYYVPSGE